MAKIAIAQVPQLRNASFQQTASTNLLSAEGAAFQRLGGTISQTAGVIDAYQEKKQKLMADAAMAQAQIEMTQADADVQSYMEKNPDKPESWGEFQQTRFSGIEGKLKLEGLQREHIQSVQNVLAIGGNKSATRTNLQAEKREIETANSYIETQAQYLIDNGQISAAVETINGAVMTQEQRIDWLSRSINQGVYSSVGLHLDSLGTPEELEEFSADILDKDELGFYSKHVKNLSIGDDPKAQEIIRVSGLDEGQRKYFARLAGQRRDQIVSQQIRNEKTPLRHAKAGRLEEAMEAHRQYVEEEGAAGYTTERAEQMEEAISIAYKGYEDRNRIKVLKQQANTGTSKEDYQAVEAAIANALLSPEGLASFDTDQVLKDINDLDVEDAVKAEKMQEALQVGAQQYQRAEEGEEEQEFSPFELLPFVAFYKDTFGKRTILQSELDLLADIHTRYANQIKATGYRDAFLDDLKDTQNAVNRFFKRSPEPTDAQLQQFQIEFIVPIDTRTVENEKHGL